MYVFDPSSALNELKGLIGGKAKEGTIVAYWPDILRSAATMVDGVMPPSQLLQKFSVHPRQHDLAIALREIGRVERTLFIIYWNIDQLGNAVSQRKRAGQDCSPELLAHISPLGWAHILITGAYRWPKR